MRGFELEVELNGRWTWSRGRNAMQTRHASRRLTFTYLLPKIGKYVFCRHNGTDFSSLWFPDNCLTIICIGWCRLSWTMSMGVLCACRMCTQRCLSPQLRMLCLPHYSPRMRAQRWHSLTTSYVSFGTLAFGQRI